MDNLDMYPILLAYLALHPKTFLFYLFKFFFINETNVQQHKQM